MLATLYTHGQNPTLKPQRCAEPILDVPCRDTADQCGSAFGQTDTFSPHKSQGPAANPQTIMVPRTQPETAATPKETKAAHCFCRSLFLEICTKN